MALLSQLIRNVAITGSTDNVHAWFAGRQGGRWAEQTIRGAFPTTGSQSHLPPPTVATQPSDPARTLRELTELHRRGVVTDAEFDGLRAQLRV
jgi:hypothetical protein